MADETPAKISDRRPAPRGADTIGRVHAQLNCDELRTGLHHVYERLKRNEGVPLNLGRDVAVLDGHESHASYRRHCRGCL